MNRPDVWPAIVLGVGDTGAEFLKEFENSLPPAYRQRAVVWKHVQQRDKDFCCGEDTFPSADQAKIRTYLKGLVDVCTDCASEAQAFSEGMLLARSNPVIYIVAGPDAGAAEITKGLCEEFAFIAWAASLGQLHTCAIVLANDVLRLEEPQAGNFRKLITALAELLVAPLNVQGKQRAMSRLHCAWLLGHRNGSNVTFKDHAELIRLGAMAVVNLIITEAGEHLHAYHGASEDDQEGCAVVGSFGLAQIGVPQEALEAHFGADLVQDVVGAFNAAEARQPAIPKSPRSLLGGDSFNLQALAVSLRALSPLGELNPKLQDARLQDSLHYADTLAGIVDWVEKASIDEEPANKLLKQQHDKAIQRLEEAMDDLMKAPGSIGSAVATAQSVSQHLEGEGEECAQQLGRQSTRISSLRRSTDEAIGGVRDSALDLDVLQHHYLSAHMGAHVLASLAAIAGYTIIPWLLLQLLSPLVGSSGLVWGLVWIAMLVGLVAAPLLNIGLRNLVQNLEDVRLVRESHLILLLPVLPLMILFCTGLVDSGRMTDGDFRAIAWASGVALVIVLWLLPYVLKGLWEALVDALESFVGLCADVVFGLVVVVIRLINVVRARFGKKPISRPVAYKGKAEETKGITSQTRSGRSRIDSVIGNVHWVQRQGQVAIFSLAIVPLFFLLVVGVVESFRQARYLDSGFVLSRMNEGFFSLVNLSVLGIILIALTLTLLLDGVGYYLQLRDHEKRVSHRFDSASTLVNELMQVRTEQRGLQLAQPWFKATADSAKTIADSASTFQRDFFQEMEEWTDESARRASEAQTQLLDSADKRPVFSPFFSLDEVQQYYRRRLGQNPSQDEDEHEQARGRLAESLVSEITTAISTYWRRPDGSKLAADEARRQVAASVASVLRPDLPEEFLANGGTVAHPIFENYASPYWHFTPDVRGLRSRDMVIMWGQPSLVHLRFPDAEVIHDPVSATTLTLMSFVYGLPLDVFPEWAYLNLAEDAAGGVAHADGLERPAPQKVPKHLRA